MKPFSNDVILINNLVIYISTTEIIYEFICVFLTGIWNKIIQDKSRIQTKQLDKILKNLETKKLIKRVTSVLVSFLVYSTYV